MYKKSRRSLRSHSASLCRKVWLFKNHPDSPTGLVPLRLQPSPWYPNSSLVGPGARTFTLYLPREPRRQRRQGSRIPFEASAIAPRQSSSLSHTHTHRGVPFAHPLVSPDPSDASYFSTRRVVGTLYVSLPASFYLSPTSCASHKHDLQTWNGLTRAGFAGSIAGSGNGLSRCESQLRKVGR